MPNIAIQEVAVIGAGLAGLSVLQHLDPATHRVTLFDKSRGTGGRLSSKKVGNSSWDMGAQYLRAHSPEFADQLSTWHELGWIAPWPVTPYVADANGLRPSPDNTVRYVGTPRMTALSRKLSEQAGEFHATTRITKASQQDGHWFLRSDDDREFGPFATLVIALPPQQAAELLPINHPLYQMAAGHGMLPSWTLLFSCEEIIAPEIHAVYVHNGPLRWMARNSSKPGRAPEQSWVLQASAVWSQQHLDAPRPEIQSQLLEAFRSLTGADKLTLTDTWLHRWLYALPDGSPAPAQPLHDPAMKLYLCGDWCQGSSAEGAWLSGRSTAALINQQDNE